MMRGFRRWIVAAGALAAVAGWPLAAPVCASAAQADPAAAQIEGFDAQLIDLMKSAKALGPAGRFHKLEPVVARAFDIPLMIRFAVGPSWPSIPTGQQQQLTEAFGKLTAASLAHNFSGYSGQHFEINPNVVTRGPDKVVSTTLVSPSDQPVSIAYRMRQNGGAWKIIDVYYNGAISQLTTRRADFQGSLEHGGAGALVAHLNALVDKEMK
jgi:phospholipid transport system substrate-binding protein